jgi:hypothetical protein
MPMRDFDAGAHYGADCASMVSDSLRRNPFETHRRQYHRSSGTDSAAKIGVISVLPASRF